MKKLLGMLVIALFSITVLFSQDDQVSLSSSKLVFKRTGSINDTISDTDSIWQYQVTLDGNIGRQMVYDFKATIKKATIALGAPHNSPVGTINYKLQGKKFESDTWTDIATKVYTVTATSTDTSFYNSVTTSDKYNYYNHRFYRPVSSTLCYPSYIGGYLKEK